MSGIVAIYTPGGRIDGEALDRATRALDHRGRAARACWIDRSHAVGLGHTRPALGDPAGGAQPASNEDESVFVAVDGAVHDAERLGRWLAARGHRIAGASDAELIAHLYEERGAACVEQLRGELAFVLYDARRDLLIAARDRLGVRPLVYHRRGGCVMFASEAKALFAAGVPAVWDREAFLHSWLIGSPAEDRTMFAGIHTLPAGHLLIATRGGDRLVRYWDLDYPVDRAALPRSEDDDRAELAEALDEAIDLRLRSEVPVACYLSGGIDSCTVLGLAQRRSAAPIRAFTLAFDHAAYDENALARDMAAHAGASYTAVPIRRAELAADFERSLYFAERPLHNTNCAGLLQLSRTVRDAGIEVVLTGEGADEIFAGYFHFRRDLVAAAPLAGPAPDAGAAPMVARVQRTLAGLRGALDGAAPAWIHAAVVLGHRTSGVLRHELADELVRRDPLAGLIAGLEVSRQLRGRHPLHRAMYLWSKTVLPGYVVSAAGDRMEMAHGVQARLPFLDHRVVELSTRLTIDRLFRGELEKHLLREVARPVVTDAVVRRPKDRPAATEIATADAAALDELVHDTLRSSALRDSPLFEPAQVLALLDAPPQRDAAARAVVQTSLIRIASVCLLQRQFAIAAPP